MAGVDGARAAESADRVALRALVDRYALEVDRRNWAGTGALFGDDGTLTTSVPSVAIGATEIAASVESATAWFADAHGMKAEEIVSQHFVGNHVCEIEGERASGSTYCLARLGDPSAGRALINVLRYDDEYAKGDHGWRFARRTIVRLWSESVAISA